MMKRILSLALALAFWTVAFAQDGARGIAGTVLDDDGTPLIGATVLVPNTSVGTVTDIDGSFELDMPDGRDSITISYLGCV